VQGVAIMSGTFGRAFAPVYECLRVLAHLSIGVTPGLELSSSSRLKALAEMLVLPNSFSLRSRMTKA